MAAWNWLFLCATAAGAVFSSSAAGMADTCDAIPGTSGALLQKAVTSSATSLATSLSVEGNEGNVGKFQPFEWKLAGQGESCDTGCASYGTAWCQIKPLVMMRYDRYGKPFLFLHLDNKLRYLSTMSRILITCCVQYQLAILYPSILPQFFLRGHFIRRGCSATVPNSSPWIVLSKSWRLPRMLDTLAMAQQVRPVPVVRACAKQKLRVNKQKHGTSIFF